MGKVKCRHCGDVVSSDAGKCPHCYSSLDNIDFELEKKSNKKRYILAIFFSVFIFFSHQGEYLSHQYAIESESPWLISFGYTCVTFAINFALASIIPLIMKIVNRKSFYKKSVLIYFLNAVIITGIYILIYDYVSSYYQYGVVGMIIYSIISYLFFVDPNEKYFYLNDYTYNNDIDSFDEDIEEHSDSNNKTKADNNGITHICLSRKGEDLEKYYADLFPIKNKSTVRLSDLKRKEPEAPEESFDDKYKKLNKLKELYDNDILTKEEFDEEKKKILK